MSGSDFEFDSYRNIDQTVAGNQDSEVMELAIQEQPGGWSRKINSLRNRITSRRLAIAALASAIVLVPGALLLSGGEDSTPEEGVAPEISDFDIAISEPETTILIDTTLLPTTSLMPTTTNLILPVTTLSNSVESTINSTPTTLADIDMSVVSIELPTSFIETTTTVNEPAALGTTPETSAVVTADVLAADLSVAPESSQSPPTAALVETSEVTQQSTSTQQVIDYEADCHDGDHTYTIVPGAYVTRISEWCEVPMHVLEISNEDRCNLSDIPLDQEINLEDGYDTPAVCDEVLVAEAAPTVNQDQTNSEVTRNVVTGLDFPTASLDDSERSNYLRALCADPNVIAGGLDGQIVIPQGINGYNFYERVYARLGVTDEWTVTNLNYESSLMSTYRWVVDGVNIIGTEPVCIPDDLSDLQPFLDQIS